MKFVLFVEGETERKVLPNLLKKWLDPQLPHSARARIDAINLGGWSKLVNEAPDKARIHLNSPQKHEIIAVISLLDLYGPTFPYPKSVTTYQERYAWAKDNMEEKVNQPKFFQFFAVHELEAWLLSDPTVFPHGIQKAFPAKIKLPEFINCDEPPAKLLERLYPLHCRREYKKTAYGSELFSKLDPKTAYDKCRYLKAMLDKMLELAQAAVQ